MPARSREWPALLGFILIVAVVSALGGWITSTSVSTWYAGLDKPAWTPPGRIFSPVWTFLYAVMAVVAWRLWLQRRESPAARFTLALWSAQLALNCAWSFLFFGLRSPAAGILDLVALFLVAAWTGARLWRSHRTLAAFWLLYLAWLGFAGALNLSIWLRSR